MSSPVGTIQSIQNAHNGLRLTVEVDVSVACPRCAAGKGCGAGLFAGRERTRTIDAVASEHVSLAVGDVVLLRLAAANLLNAALIVYGSPLAGALSGAALAYGLGLGDVAAALAALTGVAAGVIFGRWRLARPNCLNSFLPQVEKRI